ncbi:MAG: type II toxin-antitoxin system VapC family toxin [Chloroflexota bacterium]|nr:type II toxin-antitoxin system VapC family toxin [Chloroflexota bacterium]
MSTSESSTREENEGLLDTNLFIHALTTDEQSQDCQNFLDALERGTVRARLEAPVLHELTYALPRVIKQMTGNALVTYLTRVIEWPGVTGEKELLLDTVNRWSQTAGLSFVDAHLAALATARGCSVYTKNVQELLEQGVNVSDPLVTPSKNGQVVDSV